MKILGKNFDGRIKAWNILIEVSVSEYSNISKEIIENNEYQRRRVKSSSTVYSLLKIDLKQGCIIPPIVLALSKEIDIKNKLDENIIEEIISSQRELIILDGLQRTYTIRDLLSELKVIDDPEYSKVLNNKIRIEIYIGLNKVGILYRMLTLNTGQTPMSVRHQIEILYSDYLKRKIDDITLLKEIDEEAPSVFGEYKFKDVIEGFNSYLDRDYLTFDRIDILDNIKSLEKLSFENQQIDLFVEYLKTYHYFLKKIKELAKDWLFDESCIEYKMIGQPFGKNIEKIFTKSQAMTGFGSAIGKLIDFKLIDNLEDARRLIDELKDDKIDTKLNLLLIRLDNIRSVAKKIGNDQRLFFHFFFRELFDKKGDAFLNFENAIIEAHRQYERKTQ